MSYTHKNGLEYPSVTAILNELNKPALTYWAANCAVSYIEQNLSEVDPNNPHSLNDLFLNAKTAFKTVGKEATDIGSAVHHAIEHYVKHGKDATGDLSESVQNGFLAFLEWESLNKVEWLESEKTLYNLESCYAGTCDAIAKINGVKYLLDFKTSKSIYDEYRFQLAAYMACLDESEGVERIGILRLDKETGEPEFKDITKDWQKKYKAFLALVNWYYLSKKRRVNNPLGTLKKGKQ